MPNEGVERIECMRYVDIERTRGVSHYDSLAIYIKKVILRQKKNHENSSISPCKKYNFQKIPLQETKSLQDVITL